MNTAVSNQLAIFDILNNFTKSLRLQEIFHNVKKDRDAYHDAKRTSAEKAILHEIKRSNAYQNIQLRKMLKMEKRLSNIEKLFNSLHKSIGMDTFTKQIAEAGLEPIPENPELERLAEIELEEEIINIDNREVNVIDNEPELVEQLYGAVDVPNPDESIIITEEKDLTPAQLASKKRYDQIAEEVSKTKHQFEIHDDGWSFDKYLDLVENVCYDKLTEVGEPTSQESFRKRYKKDWTPDMNLVAKFDIPRSKSRNTYKPRGWEERVKKENELLEKLGEKVKKEPEDDVNSNHDEEASTSKQVKTKRVFTDENDDSGSDSIFDSDDDFQEPKQKQRKRKSDSKEDLPPPKKSKLKDNPSKPKAKSKSISQQIVKWKF